MPDLNPYDEPLRRVKSVLTELSAKKEALGRELHWFDSTDRDLLNSQLEKSRKQETSLRAQQRDSQARIASHQHSHDDLNSKIRTAFNPKNWFASDQVQYRRQRKQVAMTIESEDAEGRRLSSELDSLLSNIRNQEVMLAKHSNFDVAGRRVEYSRLDSSLSSETTKAKRIFARKQTVDAALKPVVDQMLKYDQLRQAAESTRNRATSLERSLSNASNSYERAMVHEQCESQFGVGSPRNVVSKSEREIGKINRDYEKARLRAQEIGKKASRVIDTIIVDGNNLCYESGRFIGFAALEPLMAALEADYSVTVVFDAAIRGMVRSNDDKIAKEFGDNVAVHIVSTGGKADETILDLAGDDKNTYVLSNDRFGEFNDKSVIQGKRVLRHEIVNGHIFIHDLNIKLTYTTSNPR